MTFYIDDTDNAIGPGTPKSSCTDDGSEQQFPQ